MRFKEIYFKVIPFFSKEINIDDGKIEGIAGFYSSNLSFVWDRVEQSIDSKYEWQCLMVWSMYKVIHNKAKELFSQGVYSVNVDSIDAAEIEKQYYADLQEEGYEDMLECYIGK